ncbi:PA14 domain-containing protein [Undibacterium curvum]|uniref:DUF1929 domain-containing protein n=1 Tax=Undibacterium curvum TaxID=2762294 RepID=A0ABR7A7I3_9BURK|nr:PA14 domain-containing protein [Undibacterium curvum]MBC3932845.1 DUF1929 domain-containing protein [Undibacterium curvum]
MAERFAAVGKYQIVNPSATSNWVTIPQPKDPLIDGVVPATDADTQGMFSPVLPMAINAIHLAQLPNGKYLAWGARGDSLSGQTYDLWDPSIGTDMSAHTVWDDTVNPDSFCGTGSLMPDGRLLQGEGTMGATAKASIIFDPASNKRVKQTSSYAFQRWYSTMVALPDGRQLAIGGMVPGNEPQYQDPAGAINAGLSSMTPEIYEPNPAVPGTGIWRSLLGANSRLAFGPDFLRSSYPRAWVAPNGLVFGVSSEQMWYLDPNANKGQGGITSAGPFKTGADNTTKPNVGTPGTAVMYAPGKILKVGGNGYWVYDGFAASNKATIIDISNVAPVLTEVPPMKYARRMVNATVLPDGKVFVHGGTAQGIDFGASIYNPEVWNPDDRSWKVMAPSVRARLYHNTATLMTNGTVITAGSGTPGPVFNTNAEIFYPTYLFTRVNGVVRWAARPVMSGITGFSFANGAQLQLNMAGTAPVKQMALLGMGVATHGFHQGQRRVPLSFTQDGSVLSATIPDVNNAPPGYYQLFTVDTNGVPSKAVIVSIGANVKPPPTPVTPYLPKLTGTISAPIIQPAGTASYTASVNDPSAQVSWDFGDGTAPTMMGPNLPVTHVYAAPGVYLVTLTMKGVAGIEVRTTFVQTVSSAVTTNAAVSSMATIIEPQVNKTYRVWTVNPDNNSVSVIDPVTNKLVKEIPVGTNPRALARSADGRIFVTNKDAATISVINPVTLLVSGSLTLPYASQPHGILFSPDGAAFYVALEATGQVIKYDATTQTVIANQFIGNNPRHIAMTGDSKQILVSRFITPALPGEGTAKVDVSKRGGEVVVLNASNLSVLKTIALMRSDSSNADGDGRGVPNYLGAAAISPDGKTAWIPSKKDNLERGGLRDGNALDFASTVRATSSKIDLGLLQENLAARVDHAFSGLATADVYHPSGAYLFAALESSREVAVVNAYTGLELQRVVVGLAPQSLAISPDGNKLFVQNYMDRSVSVLDLTPLTKNGVFGITVVANVKTVVNEALSAQVLLGKQLFHDAKDPRLAKGAYMSCATCHSEAGTDGRTWDFSSLGEGLRKTIPLNGRAGNGDGRMHWSGNFDEGQDFEGQIRNFAGGTGLMSDALFNMGTRSQPLGDPKAGLSPDLDALAAYLQSLGKFAPSPWRGAEGKLTADGLAGRTLFRQSCASCHSGGDFTDSASGVLHDIGTLNAAAGKRLNGLLTGIDTPTLRDVWQHAPYLHDGSAPTIEAAILAHTKNVKFNPSDIPLLAAYVRQIDGTEATNGLLGNYYSTGDTNYLTGPIRYSRIEAVNFDWGRTDLYPSTAVAPAPGVPHDYFSVRWTGSIIAPVSGTYTLRTWSDDGIRMYFGNAKTLIINNWTYHWPQNNDINVTMVAGQSYPVTIEYFNGQIGTMAKLFWKTPEDTSFVPVPVTQLWSDPAGPGVLSGPQTDTTNPAIGAGVGLTGSYFANTQAFAGVPMMVRNDTLNFSWGTLYPSLSVGVNNYSVRWTGYLQASTTGRYRFSTVAADGIRVTLANQVILENWNNRALTTDTSAGVYLTKGELYPIVVETYNAGNANAMILKWMLPDSAAFTTIPVTQLYPANYTPGASNLSGAGLRADYFPNTALSGSPSVTRIENVDREFPYGGVGGMPAYTFSVRYSGKFRPEVSGNYLLGTYSDDGVRLWVNGNQVINNWTYHGTTFNQTAMPVSFTAGTVYDIRLEYYNTAGYGRVSLLWQLQKPGTTTPWVMLPTTNLFADANLNATVPGALDTGVIGVTVPAASQNSVSAAVWSLSLPVATVKSGTPLTVNYTIPNSQVRLTNWMGVFSVNVNYAATGTTNWQYITNGTGQTVINTTGLAPGRYALGLFTADSYNQPVQQYFTIQ